MKRKGRGKIRTNDSIINGFKRAEDVIEAAKANVNSDSCRLVSYE
jgi:hypothetical protein